MPQRETKDAMSDAKSQLKQMNLQDDIKSYISKVSFDLDQNEDLSINTPNDQLLDKEKIKKSLAENTDLSEEEIEGVIKKWESKLNTAIDKIEKTYKEAKVKLQEFSEKATDAAGTFAIVAFLILLLGASAAIFGGVTGSPDYAVLVNENRVKRGKVVKTSEYK